MNKSIRLLCLVLVLTAASAFAALSFHRGIHSSKQALPALFFTGSDGDGGAYFPAEQEMPKVSDTSKDRPQNGGI